MLGTIKTKQILKKLENNLQELQSVNIDAELEAHQKLEDWTKLNDVLRQLQKDRASLESTLEQADKTAKKLHKDLEKLNEKATLLCLWSRLTQEKIEELQKKLKWNMVNPNSYVMELNEQLEQTTKDIEAIGDLDPKTQHLL